MAAVSLFWDTNMAAVKSCENTLYVIAHYTSSEKRRLFGGKKGLKSSFI